MVKCSVGGCKSTSNTHQLFCFPKIDSIRNLWMFFIVPTNPLLIGLTKDQLASKRVCQKHFDKYQFDVYGNRLRYGYPCLFTDLEIAIGEPRPPPGTVHNALSDHNYYKKQEDDEEPIVIKLETSENGEQDLTDPLSLFGRAGSAPTKPVHEEIKTELKNESENFEIFVKDYNYEVYVQGFHKNTVKDNQHVEPQHDIVTEKLPEKEDLMPMVPMKDQLSQTGSIKEAQVEVTEHNYSSNLPQQEEDITPIVPMEDKLSQNMSQHQPLGIKEKKLRIAAKAKRLKFLKAEVIRQRKIIESLKEQLNNSLKVSKIGTAVNPRYRDEKEKCLDIVTKNMTECGKIFTRMQCYQSPLKPHGRRFNMKEKVLALSIYKTSAKCYKLLTSYFAMPSTKSLDRLLTGYTLKGDQNKDNEE